jgi:hypothetical protein
MIGYVAPWPTCTIDDPVKTGLMFFCATRRVPYFVRPAFAHVTQPTAEKKTIIIIKLLIYYAFLYLNEVILSCHGSVRCADKLAEAPLLFPIGTLSASAAT